MQQKLIYMLYNQELARSVSFVHELGSRSCLQNYIPPGHEISKTEMLLFEFGSFRGLSLKSKFKSGLLTFKLDRINLYQIKYQAAHQHA